jgi:hypothetical protein
VTDEPPTWAEVADGLAHVPLLAARGHPVPTILWHGMVGGQWHVTVQNRLPGRPMTALDERTLNEVTGLIERQANAGVPGGERDFAFYVANVLFDDWDEFALGSRALDLVVLTFDCQRFGDLAAAGRLLHRAASIAGDDGLRCLVSYRALASLAEDVREGQSSQAAIADISAILDRLGAKGG